MSGSPLRQVWREYRRTKLPAYSPQGVNSVLLHVAEHPQRHLITVGIGRPYDDAARRLTRQARATGWFDVIYLVDGQEDELGAASVLAGLDPLRHEYPKGAGLWAWKPALLRLAMAKAPANAHVYYIDAGCEISPLAGARFAHLDALLAQRSALLFHLPHFEDEWTKPQLLERFPAARGSQQIQATWLGLRNDRVGNALVARWDEMCREESFIWLKDPTPCRLQPGREHRHDQSILSCIVKAEFSQLIAEPWEDFFAPWLYHRDSEVLLAPVHAFRTRDGGSTLDPIVRVSSPAACLQAALGHHSQAQCLRRMCLRLINVLRDEIVILLDTMRRKRRAGGVLSAVFHLKAPRHERSICNDCRANSGKRHPGSS